MDPIQTLEGRLLLARTDRSFAFTPERVEPFLQQIEDRVGTSRVPDEVLRTVVHLAQVLRERGTTPLPGPVRQREPEEVDAHLAGRVLDTLHRWADSGQVARFEEAWLQGAPVIVQDGHVQPNDPRPPSGDVAQLRDRARTDPAALAELVRQADPAFGWEPVTALAELAASARQEPDLKEALRPHLSRLTTVASRAEARGLLDRNAGPVVGFSQNLLELFPEMGGRDFLLREMHPLLLSPDRTLSGEATDLGVQRWGPGATFELLLDGSRPLSGDQVRAMEGAVERGEWQPDRHEVESLVARLFLPDDQSLFQPPGQECRPVARLLARVQERQPELLGDLDFRELLLERVCRDPKLDQALKDLCDQPSPCSDGFGVNLATLVFSDPGLVDRTLDALAVASPRTPLAPQDRVRLAVLAHQPLSSDQQARLDGVLDAGGVAGFPYAKRLLGTCRIWRLSHALSRLSPRECVEHPARWEPLTAGLGMNQGEIQSQLQQAWLTPGVDEHPRLARAAQVPEQAAQLHPFLEEGALQGRFPEVVQGLEASLEAVGQFMDNPVEEATTFYAAARNRLPEALGELDRIRPVVLSHEEPRILVAAWQAVTGPDFEARLQGLPRTVKALSEYCEAQRSGELPTLLEGEAERLPRLVAALGDLEHGLAALPLTRDPAHLSTLLLLQERLQDADQAFSLLPAVQSVGAERGLAVLDRVRERLDDLHQSEASRITGEVLRGLAAGKAEEDCLQEALRSWLTGDPAPPTPGGGTIQQQDGAVWLGSVRLDVRK